MASQPKGPPKDPDWYDLPGGPPKHPANSNGSEMVETPIFSHKDLESSN